MFCPKCRYEYIRGVYECPDCGTSLVDKIPKEVKESSIDDSQTVVVFQASDRSLIRGVKSILEENGIICFLKPPLEFRSYTGPVQVVISESDLPKAQELLDGIE